MEWINRIGIKRFLNKAMDISKEITKSRKTELIPTNKDFSEAISKITDKLTQKQIKKRK